MLSSLVREPIVHFVLLGGALFGISSYVGDSQTPAVQPIVVSSGKIEHLSALFSKTWQRPPSRQELQGLVDDFIREEVAYREGMRIGLDRDDTIIRRRIRQKLDFFAADLASLAEPAEEQLTSFLDSHQEAYQVDSQLTFRHVYFDPSQHETGIEQKVISLVEILRNEPSTATLELGDRTLLEPYYQDILLNEVASIFGQQFADEVDQLPLQSWHGPIRSEYGLHAVIVDQRKPKRVLALDEVRDRVRRDWEHQQRIELSEKFYQGLVGKYQVSIEWPVAASSGQ